MNQLDTRVIHRVFQKGFAEPVGFVWVEEISDGKTVEHWLLHTDGRRKVIYSPPVADGHIRVVYWEMKPGLTKEKFLDHVGALKDDTYIRASCESDSVGKDYEDVA